ncbi:cold-shock protein [Xenophilus sp. AP218F]|nr:cold-shock protein [Xenophilus sp. AP218F]
MSHSGTVKCFDILKGYGFITRPKGKDLFFNWRDISTKDKGIAIQAGQTVEFDLDESGERKNRAINVKIIT